MVGSRSHSLLEIGEWLVGRGVRTCSSLSPSIIPPLPCSGMTLNSGIYGCFFNDYLIMRKKRHVGSDINAGKSLAPVLFPLLISSWSALRIKEV